tara:strand:- start:8031 stop:9329 length:1299 start_codon:yes stop_codon:yes gene_type:complete
MEKLLKNANVYLDGKFQKINIGITSDKISYLGDQSPEAKEVLDYEGKYLLPGAIDSQVHFREPGLENKEDILHGSKAALLGGITAFFEMPNTKPATTDRYRLEEKLQIARKNSVVDYAFYIGATQNNIQELKYLVKTPGCCGIKTFMGSSTGNLLLYDKKELEVMLRENPGTKAFHCEDEDRMIERNSIATAAKHVSAHPIWRDETSALLATQKIVGLAKATGSRVHVLHVTTKEEMCFLRENKKYASVEVTPQHLSLHAPDCYERLGTYAQMNPPIRSIDHQEELWRGVVDGTVDVIGSDHAPHSIEEKSKTYPATPSGMPGVESILPLMLDHVNAGRLSLERVVELLCVNPIKLFGIQNRELIAKDADATFTVVDMKKEKPFKNHYKCNWSPFEGRKIKGWPTDVWLHGEHIMQDQQILRLSSARALSFS